MFTFTTVNHILAPRSSSEYQNLYSSYSNKHNFRGIIVYHVCNDPLIFWWIWDVLSHQVSELTLYENNVKANKKILIFLFSILVSFLYKASLLWYG